MSSSPSDEIIPPPNDRAQNAGPFGAADLFGSYARLFLADIASRGLRFFADIVLVRHFGTSTFGRLNIAQLLAVQGMAVANGGLGTVGTRDVAALPASSQSIAATVVVLRLLMGVAVWTALAGFTWLVPQYRDSLELAALYGLSMFTGAITLGWLAQGRGWVNAVAVSVLATNLVYFGGVQTAALLDWAAWSVPVVLIAGELLTAVGMWIWIVRRIGPIVHPAPARELLVFLKRSLPIAGVNILRGLILASDVLLLGLFVSKAEVGLYGAAFKLYSLGVSVAGLYFTALLPGLARQAADEPAKLAAVLYSILARALLVAAAIFLAGFVSARPVLHLLFGEGFDGATAALRVLILALLPHLAAGHFRTTLVALGRQSVDLRVMAVASVVHVAAKLALIPGLGISGAAWGTLTGETALVALAWHALSRVLPASQRGS